MHLAAPHPTTPEPTAPAVRGRHTAPAAPPAQATPPAPARPRTLAEIERAVRRSWGADTTTPGHRPYWSPGNPARDQCGVTALVLQDLLGGELVRGEVRVGGEQTDFHWWNRLPSGLDIDLTREQFAPEEVVSGGVTIARPPEIVRLREEYELLRDRVRAALDLAPLSTPAPASAWAPAQSGLRPEPSARQAR